MLDGKWVAEGKGKGRRGNPEAEYLDREPALKAERVIARDERARESGSIKGGTAGYWTCPLETKDRSFLLA